MDVLFNLAAEAHFNWLAKTTDEDWDAARRDEVDLVFYLTRVEWPHLKQSHGAVVNMASLNGSLSLRTTPVAVAHHETRRPSSVLPCQLALEGSEHGIRVNSVSPGLMRKRSNPRRTRGQLLRSLDARAHPARSTGLSEGRRQCRGRPRQR